MDPDTLGKCGVSVILRHGHNRADIVGIGAHERRQVLLGPQGEFLCFLKVEGCGTKLLDFLCEQIAPPHVPRAFAHGACAPSPSQRR